MSTCFFRQHPGGLGSHIIVICVTLNHVKPDINVWFDIDLSNYKCTWDDLFDQVSSPLSNRCELILIYDRIPYYNQVNSSNELLAELHHVYTKYLQPKSFIVEKLPELRNKYPIHESTCVYFRGTDKQWEVGRVEYTKYLEHIPSEGPIWIQSDETSFISFMREKYPERSYSIDGFSFSSNGIPIHASASLNDAVEILLIMYMMAEVKLLIGNISNVIHVALILKGSNQGLVTIH